MQRNRLADQALNPGLLAAHSDRAYPRTHAPGCDDVVVGSSDGSSDARRFVVQLHRARSRHYDLRLEMDGVLVSWAVPKGPTLDPKARRHATHVDDHPLEYFDFEGVLPAGRYGAGDVTVWDVGTWEPHGTEDPVAAVAAGELHADMYGEKLRGRIVLVRTGSDGPGRERWLLLHKRDEHAVEGWSPDDFPRSVLSGRTNDGDRFLTGEWASDDEDLPYLIPAQASIFCETDALSSYGTHTIVIGKVHHVAVRGQVAPLLYQDGQYTVGLGEGIDWVVPVA